MQFHLILRLLSSTLIWISHEKPKQVLPFKTTTSLLSLLLDLYSTIMVWKSQNQTYNWTCLLSALLESLQCLLTAISSVHCFHIGVDSKLSGVHLCCKTQNCLYDCVMSCHLCPVWDFYQRALFHFLDIGHDVVVIVLILILYGEFHLTGWTMVPVSLTD